MWEYAENDLYRDGNDEENCICKNASDNDQGMCLVCGHWISYRNISSLGPNAMPLS